MVNKDDDEDDSDLVDLLGNGRRNGSHNGHTTTATAALNLDHLTTSKQDVSPRSQGRRRGSLVQTVNCWRAYASNYISMLCYYHPYCCTSLVFVLITCGMFLLSSFLANPTEEYGLHIHDHSFVKSKYDLSMGQIDHWCLGGDDHSCRCEDPLTPISRSERASWVQAFKANRKLVKQYDPLTTNKKPLDVAFLGESIVEAMGGRWMGMQPTSELKTVETLFHNNFDNPKAKYQGVALGIAGDTAPNVLWRLMHGEMPDYFQPKIWWLSLGANDLARMECSEEVVILGVLRVVEEILDRQPQARIVINSLLPMYQMRGNQDPYLSDINDTFRDGQRVTTTTTSGNGDGNDNGNLRRHRNLSFRARHYAYSDPDGNLKKQKRKRNRTPQEEAAVVEAREWKRDRDAHKQRGVFRRPKVWTPTYYGTGIKTDNNKKKKRKKRGRSRSNNQEPQDVELDSTVNKLKRFQRGRLGRRQNHIPLFTSIDAINKALATFCKNQDRVDFFDATPIFTIASTTSTKSRRNKDKATVRMNSSRISVRGHPTIFGYRDWEEAMMPLLDQILKELKREQPQLFVGDDHGKSSYDEDHEPVDYDEDLVPDDDGLDEALNPPSIEDLYGYGTKAPEPLPYGGIPAVPSDALPQQRGGDTTGYSIGPDGNVVMDGGLDEDQQEQVANAYVEESNYNLGDVVVTNASDNDSDDSEDE